MQDFTPVVLTDKQLKYLDRHFRNTKNDVLCAKLGISNSKLHRLARQRGLTKTKQYMAKCQKATSEAARRSHIENGTYPPKGFHIPKSEQYYFRPGERLADRVGETKARATYQKIASKRRETIRKERARVTFGLPQKTKLRITRQSRQHYSFRYSLRQHDYILDEEAGIAYYDDLTKRSPRLESREQTWYTFEQCENE